MAHEEDVACGGMSCPHNSLGECILDECEPERAKSIAIFNILVQEQMLINLSERYGLPLGTVAQVIDLDKLDVTLATAEHARRQVIAKIKDWGEKHEQVTGPG